MPRGKIGISAPRRNTKNLVKNAMKRRRQQSSQVMGSLRGVDKRREALHTEVQRASAVAAEVARATQAVLDSADVARVAEKKTKVSKSLGALVKVVSVMNTRMTTLTRALTREDHSVTQARRELDDMQKKVDTFMDETLVFVNDLAHEIASEAPKILDTLTPAADMAQLEESEMYVISSWMRLDEHPRTLPAADIYPVPAGPGSAARAAPKRAAPKSS